MRQSSMGMMACAALLAACSGPGTNNGQEVKSSKQRVTSPSVSPSTAQAVATAGSQFALDLLGAVREGGGNVLYSPFSISQALTMAYGGARGTTEKEMASALRISSLTQADVHPAMNALDLALASRGQGKPGINGQPFRLNIANATWGDAGTSFENTYLDLLAENYGAGLGVVDFRGAPEPARQMINDWVADRTEQKIQNLLQPGTIDSATRLVLTNAVYFNASWATPFETSATADATFKALDGSAQQVPFMNRTAQMSLSIRQDYAAVDLPYAGDELAMTIILPDEGKLESVAASLNPAELDALYAGMKSEEVELSLPRFKYEASLSLRSSLEKLGMKAAFGDADFSGISATEQLSIGDVVHKAFIDVNEAGTEAAAATAVVFVGTSVPDQPIAFRADRPFLFLIRDRQTGAILFMGLLASIA